MLEIQTQVLLQPDQLDPRILEELVQSTDICEIDTLGSTPDSALDSGLDLIDSLLQANCTAESLQEFKKKASKAQAQLEHIDSSQYSQLDRNN